MGHPGLKGTGRGSFGAVENQDASLLRFIGLKVGTLCTDDWVVSGRGGRGSSERLEHNVTLNIGIVLALACAMATQLGFLYKHRGANAAPKVDIRHPLRTVKSLFASKWFAIGMGV